MAALVWKQTAIYQFHNADQNGHKWAGILTNRAIVGQEEFTAPRQGGDYPGPVEETDKTEASSPQASEHTAAAKLEHLQEEGWAVLGSWMGKRNV